MKSYNDECNDKAHQSLRGTVVVILSLAAPLGQRYLGNNFKGKSGLLFMLHFTSSPPIPLLEKYGLLPSHQLFLIVPLDAFQFSKLTEFKGFRKA